MVLDKKNLYLHILSYIQLKLFRLLMMSSKLIQYKPRLYTYISRFIFTAIYSAWYYTL